VPRQPALEAAESGKKQNEHLISKQPSKKKRKVDESHSKPAVSKSMQGVAEPSKRQSKALKGKVKKIKSGS